MNDLVRLVLRDLVAQQGASVAASGASLRESLSAALPDSTREIDALATAADAQIPQELRDYSTPAEARTALQSSAWRLENGFRLERPVAVWAVLTLSSATGHLADEPFHSLLSELGGESSVASGPAPVMAAAAPEPERLSSAFEQQSDETPTTEAPPVHPPPPPRPQRRVTPPPRPERARVKRQPQPPRKFRPIGIVFGIAFAILISRFASRVNTPVKPTPVPATATQTEPGPNVPTAVPPDEPDPPGASKRPTPLQVPGNLQQEKLLTHVQPKYPPLARQAKVEGAVALQILLAPDGTVRKVEPLSGHPLLLPSAMAAVKQWRYVPTMVDGFPVEVVTRVELQFHLKQ